MSHFSPQSEAVRRCASERGGHRAGLPAPRGLPVQRLGGESRGHRRLHVLHRNWNCGCVFLKRDRGVSFGGWQPLRRGGAAHEGQQARGHRSGRREHSALPTRCTRLQPLRAVPHDAVPAHRRAGVASHARDRIAGRQVPPQPRRAKPSPPTAATRLRVRSKLSNSIEFPTKKLSHHGTPGRCET